MRQEDKMISSSDINQTPGIESVISKVNCLKVPRLAKKRDVMRNFYTLVLIFLGWGVAHSQDSFRQFSGKWQVEDKQTFEVWSEGEDGNLIGRAFKLVNGQEVLKEELSIRRVGEDVFYEARVPDQNKGAVIPFTWNRAFEKGLSFENPEHDFPQKIQYVFVNERTIQVAVLGGNGDGFRYTMVKVP